MLIARHGDVGIFKVKKDRSTLTSKKQKSLTVALGEMTGHHHTVLPTKGSVIESLGNTDTDQESIFFSVTGAPAVFTHQEHDLAVLEPLNEDEAYVRVIQNEYQPFEKIIQRVAD